MAGIVEDPLAELHEVHDLNPTLGQIHLIALGIGAIIGAGIFVITGHAAASYAGPGVTISFAIAGAGCLFAGLCYAEYAAVDERIVGHKPRSLNFAEAAALPLTSLTAWEAFFENLCLPERSSVAAEGAGSVLIVGGAGGVGSIAIQIAKRVAGLFVVATASRHESRDHCQKMGADLVIDHTQELAPQLKAQGLGGVDYILNTATASNFQALANTLNPLGKLCTITGGNDILKTMDAGVFFGKRLTLTFETMFSRPRLNIAPEKQGRILDRVAELVDQHVLASTMTTVMNWHDIRRAHEQIGTGRTIGKIVLNVTA